MRKGLIAFILCLLPLVAVALPPGAPISESEMKGNFINLLDSIKLEFKSYYAPRNWKEQNNGWDLNQAIDEAKNAIMADDSKDIRSYQKIVKKFFQSTKDYHVGVWFAQDQYSWLPFDVVEAEGRYFITGINREVLSEKVFPFQVGDELITFDGRPVNEVVDELVESELGGSNDLTNRGLACYFLTIRVGWKGMDAPQGPVRVSVKPKGSDTVHSVQLAWTHNPGWLFPSPGIQDDPVAAFNPRWRPGKTEVTPDYVKELMQKVLNPDMEFPAYKAMKGVIKEKGAAACNPYMIGSTQSVIPQLGPIWWDGEIEFEMENCPFQAYIYDAPENRKVGFVRIPHYGGWDQEAEQFARIVEKMEEEADVLVIDQMYNPGGYLFYKYGLLSMLTDQPMVTPKHRMAINQWDVLWANTLLSILQDWVHSESDVEWLIGDSYCSYPITFQTVQLWIYYLRFIQDSWAEGHLLSEPVHIGMVDEVNPHPTARYTKPILLLVNHMDFSCGDFFPAILQDNDRVTMMGTRTAGAGGCVVMGSPGLNHNTGVMDFSFTCTLGERPDGTAIEDLGVTPGIWYEPTAHDVQNNFESFAQRIHEEVGKLLPVQTEG